MRRIRIESHSRDLVAGFVAGVEWVNDSAIAVVDLDYTGAERRSWSWRTWMGLAMKMP